MLLIVLLFRRLRDSTLAAREERLELSAELYTQEQEQEISDKRQNCKM